MGDVEILVHHLGEDEGGVAVSEIHGQFVVENLKAGTYRLIARQQGFLDSRAITVEIRPSQSPTVVVPLGPSVSAGKIGRQSGTPSFPRRLFDAYANDWRGAAAGGPDPLRRGDPAPVDGPPFPFSDWPYGGSVVIGTPWTQSSPLMQALWSGSHGEGWKNSGVQIYGWANVGFNVSTSDKPGYANLPAAYAEKPNTIQPDQEVLYIERQPDTVQTDHFDWGFRITNLYGLDY